MFVQAKLIKLLSVKVRFGYQGPLPFFGSILVVPPPKRRGEDYLLGTLQEGDVNIQLKSCFRRQTVKFYYIESEIFVSLSAEPTTQQQVYSIWLRIVPDIGVDGVSCQEGSLDP